MAGSCALHGGFSAFFSYSSVRLRPDSLMLVRRRGRSLVLAVGWYAVEGAFLRGYVGLHLYHITLMLLFLMPTVDDLRTGPSRGGAVSNIIASTASDRPLVNIDIRIERATANKVASVSNQCSMDTRRKRALIFSCVNCRSRRVGMNASSIVGIILGRSARVLSRIIMINCNIRGGGLIANTAIRIGNSRVTGVGAAGPLRTVRKRAPNMDVTSASNRPNTSVGIDVHNLNAIKGDTPLCLVSNINNSVSALGPTSVRDVSMLGSTTDTTVCNSTNTGNMILVAAGRKHRNGTRVDFSTCCKVRGMTHGTGVLGTGRCVTVVSRRTLGDKLSTCS